MAGATGAWGGRNSGNNRGRLRVATSQSPSSVGSGTSSVTLTVDVFLQSQYGVVWNGFTVKIAGALSWTGSANVSHGGSGGETRIARRTLTVSTQYASAVSRSFTASISGLTLFPTPPSVSVTHRVAARPISAPSAPTNASATRSSDTRYNISWTRNASTARPYSSQRVQRRDYDGEWGSWKTIATVGATATSYADTSTRANRSYQYRVQAVNSAGTGTSSSTSSVRTTPAAPTIGSASKLSNGDIRVSFTPRQPYTSSVVYLVEGRAGSGSWSQVGTATSDSFTHSDPDPGSPWSYRVRARVQEPVQLTSAYSAVSNTVELLAPPGAPTLVGPSGVLDRDAAVPFSWLHNPVDSSDQTAYELRYRINSGSWTTLSGTTAESRTLAALNVSGTVEWQVRTRGAHVDWSPWSAVGSFTLAAAPTVAINTPDGSDLHESRVDLLIGYSQSDGSPQSRVQAELLFDGAVIETLSWSGTSASRSFTTALDDDETYTVRARVQAGNGLWSDWDTVTFATDFPSPVPFEVDAQWDRASGSVMLEASPAGDGQGHVSAESLTFQRRDHEDAPWVTLAAEVDLGTTVTDPVPALGVPEYRAISHTSLPSSASGPVVGVPLPRGLWPVYLNTGPGFSEVVALYDNTRYSPSTERGKTRHRRAGRKHPVTKWGAHRDHTYTLTATVSPDSPGSSVADVQALEDEPYVACYRDVLGHKHFVTVDNISANVERDGRWAVTVPMTREDVDEATELAGEGS